LAGKGNETGFLPVSGLILPLAFFLSPSLSSTIIITQLPTSMQAFILNI
jgi:hypothetical protein